MKKLMVCLAMLLFSGAAMAQSAAGPGVDLNRLAQVLAAVEATSQHTQADLAGLRIDKWKVGSDHKRQSEADANSISSNLGSALPGMVAAVRATPTALAPGLKLYRDLNAVYEVLSGLCDSANAFGHEDEAKALAADAQFLDRDRQALVEYLQNLASYKDAQALLQQGGSAGETPNNGVKKVVVYDDEPEPGHTRSKTKPHPKPQPPPASSPAPH